LIGTLDL